MTPEERLRLLARRYTYTVRFALDGPPPERVVEDAWIAGYQRCLEEHPEDHGDTRGSHEERHDHD